MIQIRSSRFPGPGYDLKPIHSNVVECQTVAAARSAALALIARHHQVMMASESEIVSDLWVGFGEFCVMAVRLHADRSEQPYNSAWLTQ